MRAAEEQGALAVIAHPRHSQRGWTDLAQARRRAGVEVWSGDSAWDALRRRPFTRLFPALGTALSNPERAMVFALAEADPVADWMLQLDGAEPKLAFCGTDAHGWPGYATAFRWMSIHLTALTALPAPPAEGAQAVVQELAAGRFYCAVDALAPAAGFAVLPADRRTFQVGEVLEVQPPARPASADAPSVHGPGAAVDATHVRLEAPGQVLLEVRVETPGLGLGDVSWPWLLGQPVKVEASEVRRALYVVLSTLVFLLLAPVLLLARKTRAGCGSASGCTGRAWFRREAGRGCGSMARARATSRRSRR